MEEAENRSERFAAAERAAGETTAFETFDCVSHRSPKLSSPSALPFTNPFFACEPGKSEADPRLQLHNPACKRW